MPTTVAATTVAAITVAAITVAATTVAATTIAVTTVTATTSLPTFFPALFGVTALHSSTTCAIGRVILEKPCLDL